MNSPASHAGLIAERDREDIQGFVTSGFGHLAHTAYLFLQFTRADAAGKWLREIRGELTTARSWRPHAGAPKDPPRKTLNLAFSAAGLRALKLPENCLNSFPAEFIEGMATPGRLRDLGDVGDSGPGNWQFGSDPSAIHALAILCAGSPEHLQLECDRFQRGLSDIGLGSVVASESGHRPDDDKEPFGFRDGIAQPSILGIQKAGVRAGEFILGYENEYGYHPVSPLLRAELDPGGLLSPSPNPHHRGERDFGRNGTYLVYRKLEQDVAGFWNFMAAESRRLRGRAEPGFMVWLAAKMVGRWPGGAPLVLSPEGDDPALSRADDFLYAESDGGGLRCPFGAHIRRTNPRDQLRPAGPVESLHMTARHRILRRGRTYGSPLFNLAVLENPGAPAARSILDDLRDDGQKRGLHFLCVNASIKGQFEFIQQTWINNARANGIVDNPDPLSSRPPDSDPGGSMLVPREDLDLRTSPLPRFVTVRAGAYLFMPGLAAIDYLASDGRLAIPAH